MESLPRASSISHEEKVENSMTRKVRCPVATALDLVGDRWTLQVVRELLRGHSRFSEIRDSVEGIPSSILSDRLKALTAAGAVTRRFYSDHPPRAEYLLTPKGHGLGVVVGALAGWGERYAEHDLTLVDKECGHGVSVVYHCATCERLAPRNRIRIIEA
jgi:DNA-binding HxlR family transcriptional regulator